MSSLINAYTLPYFMDEEELSDAAEAFVGFAEYAIEHVCLN